LEFWLFCFTIMTEKTITAIKVQKRNPERVNIDLDGDFAFGLSRITAAWLKIGDRLTQERIDALQREDAIEFAYQRALLLLGYRARSEQELRRKLIEKNFSTEQVDQVVRKLKQANLIHDGSFARAWVENRNNSHPRSQRLMRYELQRKGVAEEDIQRAIKTSAPDQELALRAAENYYRRLTGYDFKVFRNRLSGFLARRGFSYEVIAPVVAALWGQRSANNNTDEENEEE